MPQASQFPSDADAGPLQNDNRVPILQLQVYLGMRTGRQGTAVGGTGCADGR